MPKSIEKMAMANAGEFLKLWKRDKELRSQEEGYVELFKRLSFYRREHIRQSRNANKCSQKTE